MDTQTQRTNHPRPLFERRPNYGASPLAIQEAEFIVNDLSEMHGITIPTKAKILIAAQIDAAIRKSGAPELYEAAWDALDIPTEHCQLPSGVIIALSRAVSKAEEGPRD